jgi:hypothetical protein
MFDPSYNEISDEKIRNARFTAITSVIIALGINLVASFMLTQYWYLSIIIFIATSIITIFVLTSYSEIKTSRTHNILSTIVFDSKTGELTDYPDYVVQHFMRQTINVLKDKDPYIALNIANSSSGGLVTTICM